MTVQPPVSRFAVLLAVLALFAAQISGIARNYICDCGGVPMQVATDHCVGPHGSDCHSDEVTDGTSDPAHHSEDDRREHSVENKDLLGVAGVAHSVPVAPLLAVLSSVIAAYCPSPATLEWHEAKHPCASPPPDIVSTVVLRI